jgi:CRISPR-associated protein Cas5t
MIAIRVTVPIACWRKGHSRELLETEALPPPSTCYGFLLSLVGETERERHRGARVTAGLLNAPAKSTVLRTLWQIKAKGTAQGNGQNAGPDFQQLLVGAELVVWCDSADEPGQHEKLEAKVERGVLRPESVDRFGGLSLGESTHLVNDVDLLADATAPSACRAFVEDANGTLTLPVWVDHVGSLGTRYATGRLLEGVRRPEREQVPMVPLAEPAPARAGRSR